MSARHPAFRRHAIAVAAASVWGLASSGPVVAQESPPAAQLERVEVIGVTPLPGLGVPKGQVPANVQTATSADLERSHAIDLTSFINRRLGSVYVNEVQNNPFQPDVNFRGYTASPLLGTQQGLSVYLDGVRLNQPFGDVVSWDLVPKSAISSIALMPGSNPLFGLNTLGGALSVQTKDGLKNPGSSVQFLAGSHKRAAVEFETGGSQDSGLNWFATGNKFREDGWRDDSPSDVKQLFGKLGFKSADTSVSLTAAVADTDLNGNGLQEQRFLERDYASVYTKPDNTKNRAWLLNLALSQGLSDGLSFSGNVYYRKIKTSTYNGDINDDSFDQALYQPNAGEQTALTAAGYTGFPTAGETAANTAFPKWRCIANALLLDEPAEKCNGVINQTRTDQSNYGLGGQLNLDSTLFGLPNLLVAGAAADFSRSEFTQGSELGYLNPDRSITGVGAIGDGVNGGDADGEPYDTRVDLSGRTRTYSLYGSSVLALNPATHLTLSGRYNRITVKNRDAITPGGGPGSLDGDHRYSRLNPAIGLTFSPSKTLTAYVGANQGSRAPSSIELGCADPANPCKLPNAFAGDPPLKQVVTTTFEAGLRGGAPGAFTWNVGIFRSDNKDDLLFVADDAAGFGYFKNFGKTRRQGVELGASAQVVKGLTVGANYTFLDATFRSSEVVDGSSNSSNSSAADGFPGVEGTIDIRPGDRIPLVPRHILKLFTDVQVSESWSVGLDLTAIGSSLARGNENGQHQPDGVYYLGSGRNPGYAVLNLNTDYRPTAGLKLFAQVTNLLDRKYSSVAQLGATGFNDAGNFEARPFPADANGDRPVRHATFYAPGAPRTFWVGVRYEFGDH
ncbi:TonB-dependent receptor [Methylibium sp.]|uniref:TonB-dependent receptor n=1 Tax=Methylibium sp. TaxID=2067992 RepID=UPI003D0C2695